MQRYGMFVLLVALLVACAPLELPADSAASPDAGAKQASFPTPTTVAEVPGTAALDDAEQTGLELDRAVIVFKRGGGLAGVSEAWTIYADGRVMLAQGAVHTLPAETVSALLADIEALGFFKMSDAYGRGSRCNDCFLYEITVTSGGQTKTITTVDAAPDAPAELGQVIEKINALLTSLPSSSPTEAP